MWTKIGSFLGTIAFGALFLLGGHLMYEEHVANLQQSPPSLEKQLDNVVAITTENAYCSGWVLKGTHTIVTAAHCAPEDVTSILDVDFGDGTGQHSFHIQKIGDSSLVDAPDVMTLTTNDTTIKWPVGFSLCPFKPYYGESLTMFGGPLGFSKSASFGSVENPDVDLSDLMLGLHKPVFASHMIEYDGSQWPGNSGGPVVDSEKICVIGQAELTKTASPESAFPDGVKFLTPITSEVVHDFFQ